MFLNIDTIKHPPTVEHPGKWTVTEFATNGAGALDV